MAALMCILSSSKAPAKHVTRRQPHARRGRPRECALASRARRPTPAGCCLFRQCRPTFFMPSSDMSSVSGSSADTASTTMAAKKSRSPLTCGESLACLTFA